MRSKQKRMMILERYDRKFPVLKVLNIYFEYFTKDKLLEMYCF